MNILFLAVFLLLTSCASSTMIKTDPDVAIYTDGELRGQGAAVHTDRSVVFSKTDVTLKKEGCEDNHFYFRKNENMHWTSFIMFPVNFLHFMEYDSQREIKFDCKGTKETKKAYGTDP
jgi:hypothetical protein